MLQSKRHSFPAWIFILLATLCVSCRAAVAQLDEAWSVRVAGQTIQVNADGSFVVPNIPVPDSPPDGFSDDWYRVIGTNTTNGITRYARSECFQIPTGQTYFIQDLTISLIPPLAALSLRVEPDTPTLQSIGQSTGFTVTAILPDGTVVPVDEDLACNPTYRTSNASVVSVNQGGQATAQGPGSALITVTSEGATAATTVTVSPGDPLTTVEGFVFRSDGSPVDGATVSFVGIGGVGSTGPDGRFSIGGVATDPDDDDVLDPIVVIVEVTEGEDTVKGLSDELTPVPDGFTDAGIITPDLASLAIWVNPDGGDWNVGANWHTGLIPGPSDTARIILPGSYVVTVSQTGQVGSIILGASGGGGQQTLSVRASSFTVNESLTARSSAKTEIRSSDVSPTTLTVMSGFMNEGTIDFQSNCSCGFCCDSGDSILVVESGTLTNLGTIRSTKLSQTGVDARLLAELHNAGTLWVNSDAVSMVISKAGATHVNTGVIDVDRPLSIGSATLVNTGSIALGSAVSVGSGVLQYDGGEITEGGELSLSSSSLVLNTEFVSEQVLTLSSSDVQGSGELTTTNRLNLANSSVDVDLYNQGTLHVEAANGSSTINEFFVNQGVNGLVEIRSSDVSPTTLTVASGFMNEGTIDFQSNCSCGFCCDSGDSILVVESGTLTNLGTIRSTKLSQTGVDARLLAELHNAGTLWVNSHTQSMAISKAGATHVNTGVIDVDRPLSIGSATLVNSGGAIAAGSAVSVSSGVLQYDGGEITGGGEFILSSSSLILNTDFVSEQVLTLSSSDVQGSGELTTTNHLNLANSSVDVDLYNQGTLHVEAANGSSTINEFFVNQGVNGLVEIRSSDVSPTTLTVASGFMNEGTIDFQSNCSCGFCCDSGDSILVVESGTLTNLGTIRSTRLGGIGVDARLLAEVHNAGTLWVNSHTRSMAISKAGATHVNTGVIDVDRPLSIGSATLVNTGSIALGSAVSVGSGVLQYDGGEITEGGELSFSSSSLVLNTDFVSSVDLSLTNSGIQGPSALTSTGTLELMHSAIDVDLYNQGTIRVLQNTDSTINGSFVNQGPASHMVIRSVGTDASALTVANGFMNEGTIDFQSQCTCGSCCDTPPSTLTVTNGTLTNVGTIKSTRLGDEGTDVRLLAELENMGLLWVNSDAVSMVISKAGAASVNTGMIDVDRNLTIAGESLQNIGTVDIASNRTLTASGSGVGNQAGGVILGNGTLDLGSSILTNAGTLQPGGTSAGRLTVLGTLIESVTGQIDIDIGGTEPVSEYDRLVVSGDIVFDGTLAILLIDGFTPVANDAFDVVMYGSGQGVFSNIEGQVIGNGLVFVPDYLPTLFRLTAVPR